MRPHAPFLLILFLLILVASAIPALAQTPEVRLTNVSRPAGSDLQVGDRFEIVLAAAANQPVSVRTTRQGRMDWSPVIGWTDKSGRWSTTGQFEKGDFGDWSEVWTVGGKLAKPIVQFFVGAPCLKGGEGRAVVMSIHIALTCDTAAGSQTFLTPSDPDPFRTADGRTIPGRPQSNRTVDRYHTEIMESLITSRASGRHSGLPGDESGALIVKIIGVNALSGDETRNVLAIVRTAFEEPDRIPQASKGRSETLSLLRTLANSTDEEGLKQEIAETMAYIQAQ
jgi:hypothetical protein